LSFISFNIIIKGDEGFPISIELVENEELKCKETSKCRANLN